MAIVLQNKETESSWPRFVRLRPLTLADRLAVRKWLADPEILRLTFVVPGPGSVAVLPFTREAADQYLNTLIFDRSRKTFAIEMDGFHIGNVGLKDLNESHKTADCFIEIGEEICRGKGVGTAAMAIILDYAFFELGLNEIRLEVLEFNDAAIHVYQRLGFTKTRQTGWHYDNNGQYWQVWGMTLPLDKWQETLENLHFNQGVRPVLLRKNPTRP